MKKKFDMEGFINKLAYANLFIQESGASEKVIEDIYEYDRMRITNVCKGLRLDVRVYAADYAQMTFHLRTIPYKRF